MCFKIDPMMNWRPYIIGAISALVYLTVEHFLPEKWKGWMRAVIAIAATIVFHLILDYFTDGGL